MKKKIEKFIEKNAINMGGSDSSLNANCTVLCGFALYIGIADATDLIGITQEFFPKIDVDHYSSELRRVFEFAENNNYGEYWYRDEAKKMYNF